MNKKLLSKMYILVSLMLLAFSNGQTVQAQAVRSPRSLHADKVAHIKSAAEPVLSGMSGTMGQRGWYTSPVTLTFTNPTDSSVVAHSLKSLTQQGINQIDITDIEGNHAKLIIPIDTVGPTTEWVYPDPGSSVSGVQDVHTFSTDTVSYPALVQISLDNGKTWQSIEFPPDIVGFERTPEAGWSVDWDTTGLKPGAYTLLARCQDAAGNWGNTASLTLNVGN